VAVSQDRVLRDCCKAVARGVAFRTGQCVKSAPFAISAATATLGRNPVLQFFSHQSVEQFQNFQVGQE
jgi:hypothetical protein